MRPLSEIVADWLATRPSFLASIGRPLPLDWWAFSLRVRGVVVTAIARRWPEGLTGPGGACRRCSICLSRADHCNFIVPVVIAPEGLADFAPYLDHGIEFDHQ
jgi:hypothetical protein